MYSNSNSHINTLEHQKNLECFDLATHESSIHTHTHTSFVSFTHLSYKLHTMVYENASLATHLFLAGGREGGGGG